ncbi:MAG: hypothetical protein IKN59_07165 [Paludibacteraceae bacterium]|nr:hypothetical protein [Paludibacteraceae bacterium]
MKKFYALVAAATLALALNAQNSAYLLLESTISNLPTENSETDLGTIAENPEQNAANWFNAQFVNKNTGVLMQPSEISTAFANGIRVIWVNIDRVGLDDIKTAGISDAVIADLKAFVEAGGHLLLTKQATMIAHRIGRIYEPTWGNGGYALGGDTWSINPQLGLWWGIGQVTDRSSHPIYEDVEWDNTLFTYEPAEGAERVGYNTLPLVGPVPRTDNNCMWVDLFRKDPANPTQILEATEGVTHYDNGNILRLTEFEADWNCQMLACWGHVLDFCSAGIVDMNPDGNFKGRVLGIGFAAYQWGNSNDQIANVKKLTKNAINYLVASSTGVENIEAQTTIKGIYNLLGQKVEEMTSGQIYIVNGKKVLAQ